MLAKDPARRPSAPDVAATLAALRAGTAPPAPRASRGRLLAVAGGLAVVLAALLTWRGGEPARPAARPAPASPRAATPIPPTPLAATSAPTAPPTPAPPIVAPAPPLPVAASLQGDLVALRNTGAEPLRPLEIVLVFATGRSTARHPEGLAPGEELFLALDSFEPVPPAGARPEGIEVVAGERRRRLPLR
jgi:hypothetical protein